MIIVKHCLCHIRKLRLKYLFWYVCLPYRCCRCCCCASNLHSSFFFVFGSKDENFVHFILKKMKKKADFIFNKKLIICNDYSSDCRGASWPQLRCTAPKTALGPINRHRSLGDLQSTWLRMIIFLGYFDFFFLRFFTLWESIISRAKCGENVGKPEINIASSAALNDFWVIRTTEFSKRSFIYIIMPRPEHFHLLIVTPTASVASTATQGCVLWSQSSTI